MDWRSLGYAAMIEAALLALAAFGGPHGALGAAPWVLQLPGLLLALYPTGGDWFLARVAAAALVQLGLWYLVVAAVRARRRRRDRPAST